MKTKLLGENGTVLSSLITAVLFHILKYVAFYGLYLICVMLIVPSLSLYSTELGDKLYVGYETIKPAVWLASVAVSFFLSPFVLAGFNYRFRKKMRKHFFSETFGKINYRDGLDWYKKNYGSLDLILAAILSVIVCAVLAAKMPVLAPVILLGI
ncbi:MAG: hypothetical protein IIX09_04090, partial [Clostridia bacterium]|nr:hypothetical protein [Clostridia bacterium]